MSKSASVNTRVDPLLKEQAETVLNELGISMATAMSLFLKQIVIQRGIPFEICLPKSKPVSYVALSDDDFNRLMEHSIRQYQDGQGLSLTAFEKKLSEDTGL